jgi:hypothetical protein
VFRGFLANMDPSPQVQLLTSAHEFWENEKYRFIADKVSFTSETASCYHIGLVSNVNIVSDERTRVDKRLHPRTMQSTTTAS